jgi:hypothetical protein
MAENDASANPSSLYAPLLTLRNFGNNKKTPGQGDMNIELTRQASIYYLLQFLECFGKLAPSLMNGNKI